jgi:hypothetical protein
LIDERERENTRENARENAREGQKVLLGCYIYLTDHHHRRRHHHHIIIAVVPVMAHEQAEEDEEEGVRLDFEAPDAPTEAEAAHDRHRARRFAAGLRAAVPGADPRVEDLYPWPQARVWRLPVAFGVHSGAGGGGGAAAARVDASHFRAVAALGGALVVEAPRGDCVESGCVIELPMSRFWLRRFGPNERRLCMLAALALGAGIAGVASHAVPLAQQVWDAFVRSSSSSSSSSSTPAEV